MDLGDTSFGNSSDDCMICLRTLFYDVTSVRMTKPALTLLQRAFLLRQGEGPKILGAAHAYQVSVVVGTRNPRELTLACQV